MNYWKFLLYTTIGAGLWHAILAAMGWYLSTFVPENELEATIEQYNHYIVATIVGIVVLTIGYFLVKSVIKHKKNKKGE